MIRTLLPRLLGCAAVVALVALALPALSRPAAEIEKPLAKVSPDLALVPRDALWFISIRPADLYKHPAVKALKELPELAQMFRALESIPGGPVENIDRVTIFLRRLREGPPVVIVRTVKPYDKDAVLKAMGSGEEVKAHGKSIYASGRFGPSLWLADGKTFVFAAPSVLVPYLAAIEKPARTHPLAEELKEADGTHALTAAVLPQQLLRVAEAESRLWEKRWEKKRPIYKDEKKGPREFPKDGPKDKVGARGRGERFVSYQKERPFRDEKDGRRGFAPADLKEKALELKTFEDVISGTRLMDTWIAFPSMSLLRCRRALLTVDVAPKAVQLKVAGRMVFASEADAKDGETTVDMARIIGREAATLTPARRKELAAVAAVEPLRVALKNAAVKRDGKEVTVSLEARPDPVAIFKVGAPFSFGFGGEPPKKSRPKDGFSKDRPRRDEK